MQKRFLKVAELAEYLGLKEQTIYNWRAQKKLPPGCAVKLGFIVRFDLIEIEKWLKAQQGHA